jgi:arylsulfatase A-like enzyme
VFRDGRVSFPSDALGGYSFSQYSDAYRLAADDAAREEMRLGLVDVYDGALISIDREAAQFLDALQARGLLDHTVVVFTSDHGETLDEEGTGTWGHGNSLREELTRVPLMILQPGGEARTTECVGSNTDI